MPYCTVDGQKIYYRESPEGERQNTTLVCIHGSGGDGTVWDYQLSGLAQVCRVIVPDLPGHGRSEGEAPGSVETCAARVDGFIEELEIDTFFMAGHSLGGAVVQAYACAHGERLQGVVLAATGTQFDIADEYLQLVERDFPAAAKASCENAYAGTVPEDVCRKGYAMLMNNGSETMIRDIRACSHFNGRDMAGAITTPCLVMCGSDDIITPAGLSEELAGLVPSSDLVIVPKTGHMVMIEAAELFNEHVAALLRGNRR